MEYIKNNYKTILLTILYALITFIFVIHHETWADEAQVWQLCKHLSFIDLFKHLVNEGHPSFFYLLNMPFAKLGFPILAMQIICWLASCGAVYLILNKSPFNNFTKFALITSAGFLYFFPVIARSYSILPLLVFLLAILYPKQKEHPYWYTIIIFLMANTHVIMLGFAGMLTLMFMWENLWKNRKEFSFNKHKKYVYSSLIAILGLFAVWFQLHGSVASNSEININLSMVLKSIFFVFFKFFMVWYDANISEYTIINISTLVLLFVILLFALYFALFVFLFKKNKKLFSIVFVGIAFQMVIYVLAYNYLYMTRIISAHIIIIWGLWILLNSSFLETNHKKLINIVMICFFAVSIPTGIKFMISDFYHNYSDAQNTANFILNNIEKNALIITTNPNFNIPVVCALKNKQKIYYMNGDKYLKYVEWTIEHKKVLPAENYSIYIEERKKNDMKFNNPHIYVLVSAWDKYLVEFFPKLSEFKLVYQSEDSILQYEKYYIYKYMGNN